MNHANLSNANLRHAVLFNLDFKTTENLQAQQLEGEDHPLICKVQFSPDMQIDPGRDCDRLSEVLVERYPDEFKTIEDAKAYIESL